jgi:NADPH-dependent ferric siderophore reductase
MEGVVMTEPRRTPQVRTATVRRTERLSPHLIRVVLGGDSLAGLGAGQYTDHYVKLLFPRPGVDYPQPFDIAVIRRDLPREDWPTTRTYTVRAWDPDALELALDFVHHGDEGLAGPWAAAAQPGDEVRFSGPGGAYAPNVDAGWYLFAGDESALPAIAAALERIPAGALVHAFVEVGGPADEIKLDTDVTWVHRGDRRVGDALVEAVRALEFPAGAVDAFVHGEATFVKELRTLLRVEHGIPREQLSISGYWRLGRDEDGWQSSKREWNAAVEAEEAAALG